MVPFLQTPFISAAVVLPQQQQHDGRQLTQQQQDGRQLTQKQQSTRNDYFNVINTPSIIASFPATPPTSPPTSPPNDNTSVANSTTAQSFVPYFAPPTSPPTSPPNDNASVGCSSAAPSFVPYSIQSNDNASVGYSPANQNNRFKSKIPLHSIKEDDAMSRVCIDQWQNYNDDDGKTNYDAQSVRYEDDCRSLVSKYEMDQQGEDIDEYDEDEYSDILPRYVKHLHNRNNILGFQLPRNLPWNYNPQTMVWQKYRVNISKGLAGFENDIFWHYKQPLYTPIHPKCKHNRNVTKMANWQMHIDDNNGECESEYGIYRSLDESITALCHNTGTFSLMFSSMMAFPENDVDVLWDCILRHPGSSLQHKYTWLFGNAVYGLNFEIQEFEWLASLSLDEILQNGIQSLNLHQPILPVIPTYEPPAQRAFTINVHLMKMHLVCIYINVNINAFGMYLYI